MATKVSTAVLVEPGESVPVEKCGTHFSRDNYVQGAIELTVDGVQVLGDEESDTIDALWSLIVTDLESFLAGEDVVIRFPERRYILALERASGGRVVVRFVDGDRVRTAVGRTRSVLEALTSGAVDFFNAVLSTYPVEEWTYRRDLNAAVRLYEQSRGSGGPPPRETRRNRTSGGGYGSAGKAN
ncbi:hypothetical protein [Nonomuraea glycinis]|uniref:hypothetical protein n=1 Tax=Nonomuraea glycinis TaxID=2047744 RepID=UPI002E127A75|nr:hypothetical protein OHA68_41180 [Nonomuraea glycinis]